MRSCIYSIIKSGNKNYNAIVALLNISYIYKECLCNPAIDSLYQESDRQPEKVLLYNTLQACMAHVIQANDTPPYVNRTYL